MFFGFLQRKTDFFTGAGKTEAEKIVITKFREHQKKVEEVCWSWKFFLPNYLLTYFAWNWKRSVSLECFISNCLSAKIKNCIIQVANTSSWSEVDRFSAVSSFFVVVFFFCYAFFPKLWFSRGLGSVCNCQEISTQIPNSLVANISYVTYSLYCLANIVVKAYMLNIYTVCRRFMW